MTIYNNAGTNLELVLNSKTIPEAQPWRLRREEFLIGAPQWQTEKWPEDKEKFYFS